jgi:anti-anti-sigma factor
MPRIDEPLVSLPPLEAPPTLLHMRVERDGPWVVVVLAGELELATTPRFMAAVQQLLDAGADAIRIDLGGVTFIDSTGLRALLRLASRDPRISRLELLPGPPAVQRLFELCAVEELLPLTARPAG